MTAPTPIKSPDPRYPQRQLWMIESYRAAYMATVLRESRSQKLTGSVTLHMNQGTITGLEVKTKVTG